MKKILITFALFFCSVLNINALEVNSENLILYNMNEDKEIYEIDSDEEISIASLTKIMTVLVAIENIENINAKITITNDMIRGLIEQDLATIGLSNKDTVTYEDLLYGTLLASGADAASALAISISGNKEDFVKLMNEKVEELGLKSTHFSNVIGLDETENYSTVKEVSIILKHALENPIFNNIFYEKKYKFSSLNLIVENTVVSTSDYYDLDTSFILGGKTGYTDDAGKCLASVAYDEENDITYLLVTAKAPTTSRRAYHIEDAITVYSYYFENYKYHTIIDEFTTIASIETKYSKNKTTDIHIQEIKKYYLKNDYDAKNIKIMYDGVAELSPFTKEGSLLGTVKVSYKNEIIDSFDVYLNESIPFSIIDFVIQNKYIVIGGIIVLVILIKITRPKRKKK